MNYNNEQEYISIEDLVNNKKSDNSNSPKNPKKPKKKKKVFLKVFLVILALIIIMIGLFGYGYAQFLLNKIPTSDPTNPDSNVSVVTPDFNSEKVVNILLIGVDKRTDDDIGRSDSMILLSVDGKTKQLKMTSFMRDLYVPLADDYGSNRLNAAFAFGGPDLLVKTISENFDVQIDAYAWVDFKNFIKIIDILGGIEMDVKEEEISNMNEHMYYINSDLEKPREDAFVTESGLQLLDGRQSLAYSRVRYTAGGDFQRTQRQRTVIEKVIAKAKKSNIFTLNNLAIEVLPMVNTNLSKNSIAELALSISKITNYETSQFRIPVDDLYYEDNINEMSVLVPDNLEDNADALHEFLDSPVPIKKPDDDD